MINSRCARTRAHTASGDAHVAAVVGIRSAQAESQPSNQIYQQLYELCSRSGKLSQALGVTKNFYGADLCGEEIFIETTDFQAQVATTKRINVDYAGVAADYPWRFVAAGNKFLSVK